MIAVAIAFFASTVAALLAVPVLSKLGQRVGLVDHPDDKRKLHKSAIPLIGGLAVFLSALLAVALATWLGIQFQTQFLNWSRPLASAGLEHFAQSVLSVRPVDYWELFGLALGSAVILAVGVLDDRFGIRGRQKLFGQFVATTILIIFGYHFEQVTFAGFTVKFDVFSVLFVYAWVIAAINSVNLLDGADGMAGTIGIVMSVSLGIMAMHLGQVLNAIIAFAFAGALAGFLKFNFPPAKVYLGDAGSMLIGFVLSALAIRSMSKQTSAFAFFAPLALLAIPFIDTAAAIIRRRLTGRSIFEVDRGHLHHNLMKRGFSPRISLLWVFALTLTTAAGGILSLINQHSHYALASIALVIVVMMANRIFGNAEFLLVTRKASNFAKAILKAADDNTNLNVQQSIVHVQGNRDWNHIWQQLSDFADEHGLLELTLDLNAPWIHESFHATRRRKDLPRGGNHEWYAQLPLIAGKRLFGRIELLGSGTEALSHNQIVRSLLTVTQSIERELLEGDVPFRTKPLKPERRGIGEISISKTVAPAASTVAPADAD
jgi:UDP-GlcNAc:undecaprenyl-phosphate GlcNAc-1-phosphate transferase